VAEQESTAYIELEREPGWLTVWLNRPESRNALADEMVEQLARALEPLRHDRSLRGVTFRGRGGFFCAGGDIKGFKALFHGEPVDHGQVAAANRRFGELFERINQLPQVVVMLVEGAAIGGGLGLLCAADIVVVTASAQFALTETTLGVPPAQIAPYVAQRIGLPAARRIMLTAARFDGVQAGRLGLADEVVESAAVLGATERRIRAQVLRCAPGANAATKEILLNAEGLDRAGLRQFAADRFAACMLSEEGREGVAAFVKKRPPRWAE
jgi:isohexenylglutaconyl-CoA hydratase